MIVVAIPMMAPCDKWWMMSQGSITTELVAETAESWRELLIVAVKL